MISLSKKTTTRNAGLARSSSSQGTCRMLARLRTHHKMESNTFARNWRRVKLRIKDE